VYESSCLTCNPVSSQQDKKGPIDGIYIGEMSRSLQERAVEHMKDAESYSAKSHIIKHRMLAHTESNALRIPYSRDRIHLFQAKIQDTLGDGNRSSNLSAVNRLTVTCKHFLVRML
jgi:hypothetical protein